MGEEREEVGGGTTTSSGSGSRAYSIDSTLRRRVVSGGREGGGDGGEVRRCEGPWMGREEVRRGEHWERVDLLVEWVDWPERLLRREAAVSECWSTLLLSHLTEVRSTPPP